MVAFASFWCSTWQSANFALCVIARLLCVRISEDFSSVRSSAHWQDCVLLMQRPHRLPVSGSQHLGRSAGQRGGGAGRGNSTVAVTKYSTPAAFPPATSTILRVLLLYLV